MPASFVVHSEHAETLPALLLAIGMPLALGSWWGLLTLIPCVLVLAWRLLDEEGYLHAHLPGYTEYTRKVRWRLIPGVF